jgi:hypothetical protein
MSVMVRSAKMRSGRTVALNGERCPRLETTLDRSQPWPDRFLRE